MSSEPVVTTEPKKPATTDVMLTSPEWKYMAFVPPKQKRPLREDLGPAIQAFLRRLHAVWARKTKGIGDAHHVEAVGDGESVRVHFQLHGQAALGAVFRTNKIFHGHGAADEIVEHVIEHRGGLAEVMRLAEGIVPTISAEVIPEKKNMQKRKVKKSKSTKPKTAGKTKSK